MKILTCLMCCSLGVTALAEESAGTSPLEHEREVYGRVFDRIVSRCRIWPGLAPHETSDDPGAMPSTEGEGFGAVMTSRRRNLCCSNLAR